MVLIGLNRPDSRPGASGDKKRRLPLFVQAKNAPIHFPVIVLFPVIANEVKQSMTDSYVFAIRLVDCPMKKAFKNRSLKAFVLGETSRKIVCNPHE